MLYIYVCLIQIQEAKGCLLRPCLLPLCPIWVPEWAPWSWLMRWQHVSCLPGWRVNTASGQHSSWCRPWLPPEGTLLIDPKHTVTWLVTCANVLSRGWRDITTRWGTHNVICNGYFVYPSDQTAFPLFSQQDEVCFWFHFTHNLQFSFIIWRISTVSGKSEFMPLKHPARPFQWHSLENILWVWMFQVTGTFQ